jgi:hypothetical protein
MILSRSSRFSRYPMSLAKRDKNSFYIKEKLQIESSEKVLDFILRACREDKISFTSRLADARSKNKK